MMNIAGTIEQHINRPDGGGTIRDVLLVENIQTAGWSRAGHG